MILDYSSVVSQTESFGLSSGGRDKDLYFSVRGTCLYCKIKMSTPHRKSEVDTKTHYKTEWHRAETIWQCESCGWWEQQYRSYLDSPETGEYKDWETTINSAVLRTYDSQSESVPIQALEDYITKNPDEIIDIHHNKMEELVSSVLSDRYKCEAKVIGKSHDGGIDVVLLMTDRPFLVQVKRRKSLDKTESVSQIRELLGATLLYGAKDCIFVTTGERFTRPAVRASETALKKNLVSSYSLYNRDAFISFLKDKSLSGKPVYDRYIEMRQ